MADAGRNNSGGRVHHPLFARAYQRWAPSLDRHAGLRGYRRELLAGLSGRVVEIGAGSGLNFPHYPPTVSQVVAVEPERRLREAALEAARGAPVPIEVVPGLAEALPLADESFDGAVACLVLCSVHDQHRALGELKRVLRPGGELRLLEHVRAARPVPAAVQWVADRTLWPVVFGGCHTGRDTVGALAGAGLRPGALREVRIPEGPLLLPTATHVLGSAYRPAGGG